MYARSHLILQPGGALSLLLVSRKAGWCDVDKNFARTFRNQCSGSGFGLVLDVVLSAVVK